VEDRGILQRGMVLAAVGEIVECLAEGGSADRMRDVTDNALALIVVEPVGEVVEAGGVAVQAGRGGSGSAPGR